MLTGRRSPFAVGVVCVRGEGQLSMVSFDAAEARFDQSSDYEYIILIYKDAHDRHDQTRQL